MITLETATLETATLATATLVKATLVKATLVKATLVKALKRFLANWIWFTFVLLSKPNIAVRLAVKLWIKSNLSNLRVIIKKVDVTINLAKPGMSPDYPFLTLILIGYCTKTNSTNFNRLIQKCNCKSTYFLFLVGHKFWISVAVWNKVETSIQWIGQNWQKFHRMWKGTW